MAAIGDALLRPPVLLFDGVGNILFFAFLLFIVTLVASSLLVVLTADDIIPINGLQICKIIKSNHFTVCPSTASPLIVEQQKKNWECTYFIFKS